jgi:hypothetical protein
MALFKFLFIIRFFLKRNKYSFYFNMIIIIFNFLNSFFIYKLNNIIYISLKKYIN